MVAMKKLGLPTCLPMVMAVVIAIATPSFAQVGAPPGGAPSGAPGAAAGGQAGGRGPGARGQMGAQAMLDMLKTQLMVTDDDWNVLQPKIQAVIDAQQADPPVQFGGARGARGQGRGRGANAAAPVTPSAVQMAITDLNTILLDTNSSADAIKGKLEALHQARQKANDDLTAAQTALKSSLNQRQEAVLVVNGLLN
jgi:hypothetical protein